MDVSWCTSSKQNKLELSERFRATGCILGSPENLRQQVLNAENRKPLSLNRESKKIALSNLTTKGVSALSARNEATLPHLRQYNTPVVHRWSRNVQFCELVPFTRSLLKKIDPKLVLFNLEVWFRLKEHNKSPSNWLWSAERSTWMQEVSLHFVNITQFVLQTSLRFSVRPKHLQASSSVLILCRIS